MISVEARDDLSLCLVFENGERKIFDVEPYLIKGFFSELQDIQYFKRAKVVLGSVEWPNEQDFSHDTLYLLSK